MAPSDCSFLASNESITQQKIKEIDWEKFFILPTLLILLFQTTICFVCLQNYMEETVFVMRKDVETGQKNSTVMEVKS